MPLVKRLVHLMGGNASIVSQPNKGTTVYVKLPFNLVQKATQQKTPLFQVDKINIQNNGVKILLADDDQTTQLHIRRLLEKHGYQVVIAEDGQSALFELTKNDFVCILMDVQMPVMDGVEVTKQIRASQFKFNNIPIIALTAYAMSGDEQKFLEAGMDDYVAKPVHKENLIHVLRKQLDLSLE